MYNDLNESSSSTDSDDELLETQKFKKLKQNKFLLGISNKINKNCTFIFFQNHVKMT